MKVKDVIKQLEAYDPNEEILVAYWDKEFANEYVSAAGDRDEITAEQWRAVIEEMDNSNAHEYDLQSIGEIINATVEKIVPIGSEGANA
jgi:hypothetical protein